MLRQKKVFFNCFATKQCLSMLKMLSMTPTLALNATLWYTLALSGSLLLSNSAYTALDRLTGPLLGSHRWCHDDALYPALQDGDLVTQSVSQSVVPPTHLLLGSQMRTLSSQWLTFVFSVFRELQSCLRHMRPFWILIKRIRRKG